MSEHALNECALLPFKLATTTTTTTKSQHPRTRDVWMVPSALRLSHRARTGFVPIVFSRKDGAVLFVSRPSSAERKVLCWSCLDRLQQKAMCCVGRVSTLFSRKEGAVLVVSRPSSAESKVLCWACLDRLQKKKR